MLRRFRVSLPFVVSSLGLLTLAAPATVSPARPSGTLASTVAPGGFVEMSTSGEIRPRLTASQIQALLPQRGAFTFPSPWLTQGVRITNAGDCSGSGDCVNYVGYSYWRNINNHVGSDTMLIFLGLNTARGGTGPTLFSYDKVTDLVTNLGPMFDATSRFRDATAEGWYFSRTAPTTLYLNDGAKMLRYDVLSRQFSTVFDAAPLYGSGTFIWQMHSSDDDRVHSATLVQASTSKMLGCLAYREDTAQFSFYPEVGAFDECHVDKSGRWLVILDNVDGLYGLDNRIIDLQTGAETLLLDQNGALGHLDTGFGYMVGEDDWASLPGTVRLWKLGQTLTPGPAQGISVYHTTDWNVGAGHIAHGNAVAGVAPEQQYSCSSTVSRLDLPRANEIVCYRLDGSQEVLVVAPVMTDLDASGGGDDYSKSPKGNLDVTGQYFIWTANMGGGRLDAFVVKVPSQLLTSGVADVTPPATAISSPAAGALVSGTVGVSATASDDVGVAGVQFFLDGVAMGSEIAAPPYTFAWNAGSSLLGLHTLTSVARDAAGNRTTSAPVVVTTVSLPGTPVISSIAVSWLKSFSATIGWATDVPGDSQVEYGPTTAYGSMTSIDATQTITHTRNLGGLSGGTLYHFRVRSRDLAGHLGVSADQVLTTVLDVDIGRMAHLRLDEKSGTIAADASGSGNAGTLLNGPVWIAGKSLGALSFDGVNDFVRIPHQASLDLYPMSISLWMRTGDAGTRGLVSKYVSGSLNGYQLFLKSGGICGSFFKSASRYVGDGTGCAVAAPGAFNDNLWHHLALVVDSGGGRIYVDGTLRDSKPWSGSPGLPTTTQDVWLGRHPSSLQPYLAGALDDVRIYGRGLSPVEVGALAGSPTPSGTPPLISGVTVSGISPSGATVSWLTNEPSDTLVEFGPSTSYGSMTPWSGAMVTVHGASLASLSASALYHYRVYSRDAAGTLAVSGDATFMTTSGSSAPALEPVAWTSVVNCGVSGSSLQKITGQNDVDDAGAVSQQTIPSGDGYVEFAAPETATLRMAGLSHGSGGTGYAEIDFAVRLQSGVAEVMENGVYKAESAFAAGDVFRVSVEAGSVRYYRQGSLFYVSAMPPVYPLLMDTSLVNLGAVIANAKIMRTP